MKNNLLILAAALLTIAAFSPAHAQTSFDDEREPAVWSFQGRVGALYTGGEPFENGAVFEVGSMYRFSGPIHLHLFGGVSNFDKDGDVVPITDDFASFWDNYRTNVADIVNINRNNYKLNFFGAGLALVQDLGSIEVHLNGGAGAYQLEFVTDFDAVPAGTPVDDIPTSIGVVSFKDEEWLYGFTAGGGIYYDFNQIISFGGHVNYHSIDTEAIDDLISFTFGMHIKVP